MRFDTAAGFGPTGVSAHDNYTISDKPIGRLPQVAWPIGEKAL